MGGKKKAPEKKKAAGDDDGDNPAEMNVMLEAAVDSLRQQLVLESERKDKSQTVVKLIQDNEETMTKDLKSQEKETKRCVEDMTEQYKKMELKLQNEIKKLDGDVKDQEEEIKKYNEEIEGLKAEKEKYVEEYDEQIRELERRINEMSSDFADMLKDTLVSMQDRIEFANQDYPDEANNHIETKFQQVQDMNNKA